MAAVAGAPVESSEERISLSNAFAYRLLEACIPARALRLALLPDGFREDSPSGAASLLLEDLGIMSRKIFVLCYYWIRAGCEDDHLLKAAKRSAKLNYRQVFRQAMGSAMPDGFLAIDEDAELPKLPKVKEVIDEVLEVLLPDEVERSRCLEDAIAQRGELRAKATLALGVALEDSSDDDEDTGPVAFSARPVIATISMVMAPADEAKSIDSIRAEFLERAKEVAEEAAEDPVIESDSDSDSDDEDGDGAAKTETRVVLLGLSQTGKTTALYAAKTGGKVETIPTIGFNVETIKHDGRELTMWDIGGSDRIVGLWRHYLDKTDVVVFFVCEVPAVAGDSEHHVKSKEALQGLVGQLDATGSGARVVLAVNGRDGAADENAALEVAATVADTAELRRRVVSTVSFDLGDQDISGQAHKIVEAVGRACNFKLQDE